MNRVFCWIAGIMLMAQSAIAQQYEEPQSVADAVQVIEGLTQRRLFDLVTPFAEEQLSSEAMDRIGSSSIVLALVRSKVTQGTHSLGEQRALAFEQAERVAADFAARDPNHPRQPLVDVQVALAHLQYGSLVQQELAAEIAGPEQRTLALNEFRQAASQFREINKQIDRLLPIARTRTLQAGELSPEQLGNLKNNVQYRTAEVNLARAQLYELSDRLNRIDALNQVLSQLEQVVSNSNPDIPLWWDAQVSRASAFRLVGQQAAALELLRKLPANVPNPEVATKLLTEKIYASIQSNNEAAWDGLLTAVRVIKYPTPRLQLAELQLLMAKSTKAAASDKADWQKWATDLVAEIENRHGPYWGRRAEIVLVGSVETSSNTSSSTGELQFLLRQGDTALRRKNYDAASKAFLQAVKLSTNAGQNEQAIATTARLSECYELASQHEKAAECLLSMGEKLPKFDSAAKLHLRGCGNLLKLNSELPPEETDRVIENLQTHIANWPEQESANQARLWLGNVYQKRGDWRLATQSYSEIELGSPLLTKAALLIGPTAQQWIRPLSGRESQSAAREFVGWMRNRIESTESNSTSTVESKARLLIPLLDIGLQHNVLAPSQAVELVESVLDRKLKPAELRESLMVQRLVALFQQADKSLRPDENFVQVESAINELPSNARLLASCLDKIKRAIPADRVGSFAKPILKICNKAKQDPELSDREFWEIESAIAGASAGEPAAGTGTLEKLARQHPKSSRIQLAYARALSSQAKPGEAALQQWRRIASRVKKDGEHWLEAKYNVIQLLVQNEQRDEAEKLESYLSITSTAWRKSKWKKLTASLFGK